MKLAFCLFKYFPYGGLQRDFLRIAAVCLARGHDVHVYTTQWEGEKIAGLQVHLIQPDGLQNHTRNRSFAKKVKQAVTRTHYDVVMGFNKMPELDIYYAADVCYQSRVAPRGVLYRLMPRYRQLVAMEQAVFAQGAKTTILLISALQQAEYQHCYQTEKDRFYLLPPGIAKDRCAPANASEIRDRVRQQYQLAPNDFILLMVGSGFKTKGVDRILQGVAALPSALRTRCRLLVIGQDRPAVYQKLAQQLQIADRVLFLGGRPDVPDFLLAADVLLHPAYHENTGTVLLEAVIAGLPVLTVDVCGYAHYVTEADAGIVLPSPFDQSAFNVALETILRSPKRQQWRQNGLAFGKQADIYSLPEKAADLIEKVGRQRASISS